MPRRQRKKDRRSDEEFTDFKDDSSLINYLTKQYIDNELAVDKSKKSLGGFQPAPEAAHTLPETL